MRDIFLTSLNNTSKWFDLVHCDPWDPFKTMCFFDSFYFLTVLDDYSRALWIHLLVKKWVMENFIRSWCKHNSIKRLRLGVWIMLPKFTCLQYYFFRKGHFTSDYHRRNLSTK